METLLCLTSKRANKDSLKDEMRKLKGIDFILDTVLRCNNYDEDGQMIIIDRCMHVLENVSSIINYSVTNCLFYHSVH